jgi:3-hydroxy-3-methylglutaryl CoA synthase
VNAVVVVDGHGGYVPLYRVRRDDVAAQFGGGASGESAVPARDENHVTMAGEAAETALSRAGIEASDLGAVLSASVTDPLAEHGVAAHVAYRMGATGDVRTGDFRSTRRASTDALVAAEAYTAAGDPTLVVAVDVMPADPDDDGTAAAGAGAGAFVLRPEADAPVATVEATGRETTGFVEHHREHGAVAETGDARFERRRGVRPSAESAVERALGDATDDPGRAVAAAPDRRMADAALDSVEVDRYTVRDAVGDAGAASFALDLVAALESADPGTEVLAVNYGAGGADAVRLTAGDAARTGDDSIEALLDAKEYVTYAKHLEYREPVDYQGVTSA